MSESKTYRGSCHCGNVKYEVELDLSGPVLACNCSMCSRTGSLMAFVPENQFRLLAGDQSLSDYQFNTKKIHHLFCRRLRRALICPRHGARRQRDVHDQRTLPRGRRSAGADLETLGWQEPLTRQVERQAPSAPTAPNRCRPR